jgi:hypothetical protein
VRSIDVKGGEIEVFKTLINKGFPSVVSFSRLFSRADNAGKPLFLVVEETYQRLKLP